uniref:Uncharacterized protein n=1 Tax=Onchocerca volvulus TaxID=6282 RepID=A0A8R1XYQ6_ONCVO
MRNSRDTRRRRRRRRQRWRRVGHFFCHRRGKMTKRRMIINVIGRTDKENNERFASKQASRLPEAEKKVEGGWGNIPPSGDSDSEAMATELATKRRRRWMIRLAFERETNS